MVHGCDGIDAHVPIVARRSIKIIYDARGDKSDGPNVNRPGESGDSACCLAGLGEGGVLTVVGGLEFGWGDVAASFVESAVVEPVDVLEGGDLDLPGVPPGSAGLDQLGFEQADHRFGQCVIVRIATTTD